MLRIPRGAAENGAADGAKDEADETELILALSRRIMAIIRSGDGLKGAARDAHVVGQLQALEASYGSE